MFVANAVVIDTGSVIRWSNPSSLPHNVVGILNQTTSVGNITASSAGNNSASAIAIDSGFIDPGESWQYRFEKEGIFNYLCTIHSEEGMRGTIIVTPSS
jgi:plastocyanin